MPTYVENSIFAHVFLLLIGFVMFIKGGQFEAQGNSVLGFSLLIAGVVIIVGNVVWMAGSVRRWRL